MAEHKNPNIGGLLLAAGSSSRLGHAKQLLVFEGKTLIRRSTETLLDAGCRAVVVVLGAEIDGSVAEIEDLPVHVCINKNWETGMGSSIIAGLEELRLLDPNLTAIVITLCDQPYVTSHHIRSLIDRSQVSNSPIVAAKYGETIGVPALFSRSLFDELMRSTGDKGARQMIRNHRNVEIIEIQAAVTDIDTLEDAKALLSDQH